MLDFRTVLDQSPTDFDTDSVGEGLLFAPLCTSARAQSRVEFVELGGGTYVL